MTHDSTLTSKKKNVIKSPRKATIDFIRHFSASYVCIQGMASSGLIIN